LILAFLVFNPGDFTTWGINKTITIIIATTISAAAAATTTTTTITAQTTSARQQQKRDLLRFFGNDVSKSLAKV